MTSDEKNRTRLIGIIGRVLFGSAAERVGMYLGASRFCGEKGWTRIQTIIHNRMQTQFSLYISPKAKIARTVRFPHPCGIVIGDGVEIGDGVWIFQNVTLGAARRGDYCKGLYPKVGRNAVIYAGAVVVGDISLGQHCVVGANAVVVCDIPDRATAIGAPASYRRSECFG